MNSSGPEVSTPAPGPPIRREQLDPAAVVLRRPGRNRSKADVTVYRAPWGRFAVKDYARRPWPVRATLGRWLIRREGRAYAAANGAPGLVRFVGPVDAWALAVEWIDAPTLAEFADGAVSPERFDRLESILNGLHERGVALADLSHRDVLLEPEGGVRVVDLAAAWVLGENPGPVRRRLFEHFREADRFAAARLRCRFTGAERERAFDGADPAVVAWHRRARRLKYRWDKLRGARRLPPVDDHWRF